MFSCYHCISYRYTCAIKKSRFFRLTDEEFEKLETYCKSTGISKSDVLRELIRSLKIKKKPS
ncbi:ribbon-helix-helix protein, CopG family [Microcoleus sp. AR_TQ3_B6]|uniref:ribbon-helix-helix protein, CopG family n=1 Tax=Microcoleus sp. AR_TQ3_B6 TaxID=3055284 RepID=UPI002FCEF6A6